MLKLRNWSEAVKDRKAWNDVVQKTNNPCNTVLEKEEEEEEKKKSLWSNSALSYLLNTFKHNIIYSYLYIIVYVTNTE
jgi:flagellar capping protein FliD